MTENKTDIFAELAGGNEKIRAAVGQAQGFWHQHTNKRTRRIVVTAAVIAFFLYFFALRTPEDFPVNSLVTIEQGKSFSVIAQDLQEKSIVRSATSMRIIAMLYGAERDIHAGDYLFKKETGLLEVIRRLSTGSFGLEPVKVRVREGGTVDDVAEILSDVMLKFDKEKFLEVAGKSEGYLFPDTYYFLPNAPETQIVEAMKDNFHTHYKEIEEAAAATGYSMHEIVTIASIVELEASKYEDRRKIAGVIYNRLEINMPLQVDVSFVYIMNKGTFDITREDLQHESPYNTYVHKGLPPGPIGSPSLASLKATVDSVDSDWLFYLADRYGTTYYSTTYAQHLTKKRRYIDNR
jgi:UPF0755 protein